MGRFLRIRCLFVLASLCLAGLSSLDRVAHARHLRAPAQPANDVETVSADVWLGSSMFTVEDLENLHAACTLLPEQKEAALDLMRGAMSRARGFALKGLRDWEDTDWNEDPELMMRTMEEYKKRVQRQCEDILTLEREVMGDLKSLLEQHQINDGWWKFERSRRRLLIRGAKFVVSQAQARLQQNGITDHLSIEYGGTMYEHGPVDVIAMVRATKLSDAEYRLLADAIEQYETSMDSLITSWRPFVRGKAQSTMTYWMNVNNEPSVTPSDVKKMQDLIKRMRQLQVRSARAIEDALQGESRARFQRERLRRESRWRWQPAKRTPVVISVLRLRSLTPEQKSRIDELVKHADSELLKLAIQDRHKQDEMILMDKVPKDGDDEWPGSSSVDQERAMKEHKVRRDLSREVLALLTVDQRTAYDTGIENEQDLIQAFDKRRVEADTPWEIDRELNPWMDMWQAQHDEE